MGSSLMRILHHSSVKGQKILFSVSHCARAKMLNNIQHPASEPMKTALSYAQKKKPEAALEYKTYCACHLSVPSRNDADTRLHIVLKLYLYCSNWPSVSLVSAYNAICEHQSNSIGEQSSGFGLWQHWADGDTYHLWWWDGSMLFPYLLHTCLQQRSEAKVQ